MVQGLIDVLGKLGPLAIAIAVFAATNAHNRWVRAAGVRAAAVDDQKLRLELLERRIVAIEAIGVASAEFMTHGRVTDELRRRLVEALKVAELVFELEHEATITELFKRSLKWQGLEGRIQAAAGRNEQDKLDRLLFDQTEIEDEVLRGLPQLREALRKSARVSMVPEVAVEAAPARDWSAWLLISLVALGCSAILANGR